ncbi:DUF6250 domain-containing protein [Xylophilus sp.]|uniref:DUF6250 domain-containing protein n=1 Tax=Xylophilus sp. TaxID=2653893 RepID=UPI0013BE2E92|nr:DUF6250 domain-containing protein [Xylophilus sp.]KAF1046757.1 MAG: hypothetical protein GAK38_02320 [Xylophilus sp.]
MPPSLTATLIEDRFQTLDAVRWKTEAQHPATQVYAENGELIIDAPAGVTVWLVDPLDGDYRIEFRRRVLLGGGRNDRLSDLNQFWAARDPHNPDLFTRSGALEEYAALDLYYVGLGGNGNTTTRFRRYDGQGARHLFGEYLDAAHLLRANHSYVIRIDVTQEETAFWVDDERLFHAARHGAPSGPGHFGFRSVLSRQAVSAFRVTRL